MIHSFSYWLQPPLYNIFCIQVDRLNTVANVQDGAISEIRIECNRLRLGFEQF